ncbi:MAG: Ppx/GppA family phosphatase [Alphaproteobacteria bacterium]|nr:MAG: Ppx/GppA family phosphatase [Alphaproteobacteria bacterium]
MMPNPSRANASSGDLWSSAEGALFAAVDLGTNNCRLLVARACRQRGLAVVDAFSRVVRLGEGVAITGLLCDAAMDRAISALRVCAGKLRAHRPVELRVVATEACRRARNGEAFLARARRETGLPIEVIAAEEEALLALGGCAALLEPQRPAVMFDIGGGSTEVLWVAARAPGEAPQVLGCLSMPAGVVALADRYGADALTLAGYRAMRQDVATALVAFDQEHGISGQAGLQMLGSSGTVTTLAGLHLGLARYDRTRVDGLAIAWQRLVEISRDVVAMGHVARQAHPCIGRARADLVVAGCAILDAILHAWPVDRVRIADRGVREGILLDLMGAPMPRRAC